MCRIVVSHWSGSSFTKCIAYLRQDIMRCKKCGSHSASIWVHMSPYASTMHRLKQLGRNSCHYISLMKTEDEASASKKDSRVNDINLSMYQITERPVAGCLMAYHGVWDLRSWCGGQGCDLVLLVVWGCDRDNLSPGVEVMFFALSMIEGSFELRFFLPWKEFVKKGTPTESYRVCVGKFVVFTASRRHA